MFNALTRLLTVVLLAAGAIAGHQTTPQFQVMCSGQGFTHVDVEPFHGDPATLTSVCLVIDETISLARYTGENLLPEPMQFDASAYWLVAFKHELGQPGFAFPQYIYANCGGITLPAFDGCDDMQGASSGSFFQGGGWATIPCEDYTHDFAPWADANAPGGMHRIHMKSYSGATWSVGVWDARYSIRVRYKGHIEYTTAGAT